MDSAAIHNRENLPASSLSGWKVLGVFFITFIAGWIAGAAVGLATRQIGLLLNLGETAGHTLSWVGITTARLILWLPATWYVFRRSLFDIGFGSRRVWWLDLLHGIGFTSVALAIVFVIAEQSGWLVIKDWVWQTMSPGAFAGRLWVTILINACVALGEEVMFRGYLLTGLRQAWGRWPGLIVMMAVFGLIHLPAYSEQGFGPVTLVLAVALAAAIGLALGLVTLRTGSLWMPIGIHFAWNLMENDLLNLVGDPAGENLIGALTRLQGPLSAGGTGFGNIMLDLLAFGLLCVGLWLSLRGGASRAGKQMDGPRPLARMDH